MFWRENARCAILPISSLLAMLDMIPVLKTPFKEFSATHGTSEVLKRVFGYTRHTRSDKREFKESFSNMSAPMILRENARCAFLLISSLLAMIKTIPVFEKTPF